MQGGMEGRVCVVTGPTSGIGRATALGLARRGARVILACRDAEKGQAVRGAIASATGNDRLEVARIDLEDRASIRAFAVEVLSQHPRIHVLVNNAGVLSFRRVVANGGVERHFAIHVLGPFLLTNLLLPAVEAAVPARIINVGSATHWTGRVDFDNLQGEREYRFIRAYANSKLEILLLTYELARRLAGTGVTVNCVHPGAIRTDLYNGLPVGFRFVKYFLRSPATGAEPIVRLATSPDLGDVSGRYFDRMVESKSAPASYDTGVASRLWNVCEGLAGPTA